MCKTFLKVLGITAAAWPRSILLTLRGFLGVQGCICHISCNTTYVILIESVQGVWGVSGYHSFTFSPHAW